MAFTANHLIATLEFSSSVLCSVFNEPLFFHHLFSCLNAPVLWRNACPYIPSTAKSHWSPSHSEQTMVKRQKKNQKKKTNKLTSLQLIRTFQQQKETHWTATWHLFSPLLPPKFWYIWLALCEKTLAAAHKNTLSPSSTFHLQYYPARPCGGQEWRKERVSLWDPFLFGVK